MGSSKKVTIGYRYFFGIHMGLGRGPLDALLAVKVGGKVAWQGHATGNQTIQINQPNLFGGDKGEGGIQGSLDVMMGAPDQPVNGRLAAMLGGIVPAFRGVATLFYDGLVTSLNPYPKPWEFRVRRILKGWDGEVWYPEKAPIPIIPQQSVAIYIALDLSGSMNELTGNGLSRLANAKTAINGCLDMIKESIIDAGAAADIMIVGWGSPPDTRQSITRRSITSAARINDLKSWVSGRSTAYGTYFPAGLIDMSAFFAGSPTDYTRLAFFITDGEPASPGYTAEEIAGTAAAIVWANAGIPVHGINIDLNDTTYTRMIDTTDWDDVPVVDGGDPSALTNVIMAALGGATAMNPAHILYECYTNRDWGRGLDAARLDLDSFTAAADQLFSEGFGLCLKWTRQDSLANFIGTVLDHIGGSVFTSRRTGQIVLRLIRDDYDTEDLPLFTPDTGLLAIDENDTGAQDRAINEVVVKWRDPVSNEVRQVRAQNLAGLYAHGVISETTEYPGIPSAALAARIAQRDLAAYSSGVKKLKVRLDRRGRIVEPAGAFRISDPARGIDNLVLRAGRVDDSEITSGEITITAVQDVFGLPAASYAEPSPPIWTPPSSLPVPLTRQRVIELPYRDLVRITAPADLQLIDDTTGYLLPLASKPSTLALGFDTLARVGSSGDFEERAGGEFVPSATIVGALDYLDTEAVLADGADLDEVVVGGAALINDEIVRVDALDLATGAITLGRGCADTVPARHTAGATIWFIDEAADGADPTEYIASSEVQAKLLTRTSSGVLAQAVAPTLTLEMVGRHARPYPPAGLLLNGEAYPGSVAPDDVVLSWAHRDRLLQADQLLDTGAGDVGPESGTTYNVRYYLGGELLDSVTGIIGTIAAAYTYPGGGDGRIELESERDGLSSWQKHVLEFTVDAPVVTNYIALPLTYDEQDADGLMTWVRQGNGPHVTPMGFEGDGYEARLSSTTIPAWMAPASARFTLHASMAFYPQQMKSSSEFGVYLGENDATPIAKIHLTVVPDATNPTTTQCAVAVGTGGSGFVTKRMGRSGWKFEQRMPELTAGGAYAIPQGVCFINSDYLLFSVHFEDTFTRVYKLQLSTMSTVGSFDSADDFSHIATLAFNSSGDLWCTASSNKAARIDLAASLASGSMVTLDVCDFSGVNIGALDFISEGGTEYAIIPEYLTSGSPYFYVFLASALGTTTLTAASRYKRFTGAAIRVQGCCIKSGRLLISSNSYMGGGTGSSYGWVEQVDIAAAIASTADGGSVISDGRWMGASRMVEDISVHPGTGDVWMSTEGVSSAADVLGHLALWSSPLDGSLIENHYTLEYDGAGTTTIKINNRLYDTLAGTAAIAVDCVCIGGPPTATPGMTNRFLTGYIRNVVLQDQPMSTAQYQAAVNGDHEPNSLTAYEFTLTNPGAEAGTTAGWANEAGGLGVVSAPAVPPHSGTHSFSGGASATTIARQRLDILAQTGLTDAEVDEGSIWAKVRWWQSSYGSNQDPAGMGLRTLDGSGAEQGGAYSGIAWTPNSTTTAPFPWYPRAFAHELPAEARSLDAVIRVNRTSGTNNDGWVDDVSVTVYRQ